MSNGGFRAGRGCVDQIFTLKQIGEKAQEKNFRVYVGFIDLEKPYDRVNKEAFCQVVAQPWKRWIYTVQECLRKKVWMSGKQREWHRIRSL